MNIIRNKSIFISAFLCKALQGICIAGTVFLVAASGGRTVRADTQEKKEICGYLGKTYSEILSDFDDTLEIVSTDQRESRICLTDGEIWFFFEYLYMQDMQDIPVNEIAITGGTGKSNYRIGDYLTVGATRMDEIVYLEDMGYTKLFSSADYKNYWVKDDFLVIVTRGPWAGADMLQLTRIYPEG